MNIKCPICHKEQSFTDNFECCIKVALNIFDFKLKYIIINNIQINFFYLHNNTFDISFIGKEIYTSISESKDEIQSKIKTINRTLVLDELVIYLNKVIDNLIFI